MSKTEKTDSNFPVQPASRTRVVTISRRGYGFRIRPNPTLEFKAEKAYVPFEGLTWKERNRTRAIDEYIGGVLIDNVPWARGTVLWTKKAKPIFGIYWRTNRIYQRKPNEHQKFPDDEAINDQEVIAKLKELFDIDTDTEPSWFNLRF